MLPGGAGHLGQHVVTRGTRGAGQSSRGLSLARAGPLCVPKSASCPRATGCCPWFTQNRGRDSVPRPASHVPPHVLQAGQPTAPGEGWASSVAQDSRFTTRKGRRSRGEAPPCWCGHMQTAIRGCPGDPQVTRPPGQVQTQETPELLFGNPGEAGQRVRASWARVAVTQELPPPAPAHTARPRGSESLVPTGSIWDVAARTLVVGEDAPAGPTPGGFADCSVEATPVARGGSD